MIKHHLHTEILMSYAAGNTSPSESLIIASHITSCAKCRKDVDTFEDLGGNLLVESDYVDTNSSSLDNIFSKIDSYEETFTEVKPKNVNSIFNNIPAVLHKFLPEGNTLTENWNKGIGGIKYFDIDLGNSNNITRARMLSIPPGKKLPHHGHESQEYTLVIEGGFSDENGSYDVGDVAIENEDNLHTPIADHNEGCICLVVYEGNLKFKGIFGPILNFLKI
jgi:putative transcriptional regulator